MSAKEKYEGFYSDLVKKLPMNDSMFLAGLTSAGLFAAGNLKDEVNARGTAAEKATHFLDEAISPYIEEDDVDLEPLYKLLKVMEKHGGVVKRLAEKIKSAIPPDGSPDVPPPGPSGHDSIVKKVMKNYQPLSTLNADALLMDLYARDVITTEEKEIIETTIPLRSKKMQFIIDKVIIPSLKVGTTMKFKNFLEAMEASEDLTIKEVGSRLGHSTDFP